jgi:hypothetical protein
VCGLLISRKFYLNYILVGLSAVVPKFLGKLFHYCFANSVASFGGETDIKSIEWISIKYNNRLGFMKI